MEDAIRGKLTNLGGVESRAKRKGAPSVPEEPILDRVRVPADLRSLTRDELKRLCAEVRTFLVDRVEAPGFSVDSSLGVVELTAALETVLNLPQDRLVWDTGHQTLVHKLFTGRREELLRLGQPGSISGYPVREESPFDTFGAGHSSTAISAVLGMATARDLSHEKYRCIAVIGDGAMTGGMAYEALNNAGKSKRRMLVILNDNGNSVQPKVGTIYHHLTAIRTNPHIMRLRDESMHLIERLPALGEAVGELAKKMEQAVKNALVPGALYEALGFNYIGPVDGHDLDALLDLLPKVMDRERPTLLHVLTHRAQGRPAGSVVPTIATKLPAYTDVFGEAMVEAADAFPKMVAITASMATGTGLKKFREKLPDRYFDVGIAESHGICFAAGMACDGARPVATISSSFLQRAYDQIVHEVAVQRLPVVFAQERAGLVGESGTTHHGVFDLSYLRCIPGMTIAAPKDGNELRDLLWTALSQGAGPFALRYPRSEVPAGFDPTLPPRVLPIGSWQILREGADCALLAVGSMVEIARRSCDLLAEAGIEATLVNCRFIKPLDQIMLRQLRKRFDLLVTIEENALLGGFGDGVLETLNEEGLSLEGILRKGLPDRFVSHGPRQELLEEVRLSPRQISDSVIQAKGGRAR